MKWKVGDKVRLVGSSWSPPDGGRWGRGTQHTVTGVCEGKVRLGEKNHYWHLGRGWEIELVERKEENMRNYVDIVFTDPPSAELTRFVEVENSVGQSVSVGKWIGRSDGTTALRLTVGDIEKVKYELPTEEGWYLDKNKRIVYVRGDNYNRPGDPPYHKSTFAHAAPFTRLVEEV